MRNAFIYGSGSIACRHSRILSELNFSPVCISNRIQKVSQVFHPNKFQEITPIENRVWNNEDIHVIACESSRHTELVTGLLTEGVSANRTYCEKPGPTEELGIKVLYNMEFLDALEHVSEKVVRLVHHADARKWPSEMDWSQRYMFRKNQGGGAILTHSHELYRAFCSLGSNRFSIENSSSTTDIDGNELTYASELNGYEVTISLDLLCDTPIRFWEFGTFVFAFYGNVTENVPNKEIIQITAEEINHSYVNMWQNHLSKTAGSPHTAWIHKYA